MSNLEEPFIGKTDDDGQDVAEPGQTTSLTESVANIRLKPNQNINASQAVLDLNLRDLLVLDRRIAQILNTSCKTWEDSTKRESMAWSVQCAVLRAMFSLSSERLLGVALLEYVVELSKHRNLSLRFAEFVEDIQKLFKCFLKILAIESLEQRSQVLNKSQRYDLIRTRKEVFQVLNKLCRTSLNKPALEDRSMRNKVIIGVEQIINILFSPNSVSLDNEKKKTAIEELQDLGSLLSSKLFSEIASMDNWTKSKQQERLTKRLEITSSVIDLAWIARAMKPNCENEKEVIENHVREVVFHTIDMIEASIEVFSQQTDTQSSSDNYVFSPEEIEVKVQERARRTNFGPLRERYLEKLEHLQNSRAFHAVRSSGSMFDSPADTVSGLVSSTAASSAATLTDCIEAALVSEIARQKEENKVMECVATPFSEPVYLRGGGSSGGDNDGGRGEGEGGSSGEGSSRATQGGRPCSEDCRTRLRLVDSFNMLADGVNTLCRITSQINAVRDESQMIVHELARSTHRLGSGRHTCSFSYEECVEHLKKHKDSIQEINDPESLNRVALWRMLRFVNTEVCRSLDLAAQCAYFLMLENTDKELARTGMVDVGLLRRIVEKVNSARQLILLLELEQVKEGAVDLKGQIAVMLLALNNAAQRSIQLKERFADAAVKVDLNLQELNRALEMDERDGTHISKSVEQLRGSLTTVDELISKETNSLPEISRARIPKEAGIRRDDVVNAAKTLAGKTESLVKRAGEYETTRDETLPGMTFDLERTDVVQAFEALLTSIIKNGQIAEMLRVKD